MTGYGHAELVSVPCGLNPSPAFQAPSPRWGEGKEESVGDSMHQNNFTDKVYSLFTIHLFVTIRFFHVSLLTFH